ncbi:tetratricopeptide repeat protein [Marinoscillum pacificum]|uniref:tetratricopeptide repeat protein n=1 Tax=Marinoscillum pacificum TaxID=392723 RepID=UPI0021586918|nr:hypothetical protein [Marinoscillum pacificum]
MNKQKFVEFLRHPSSLDNQSVADLESVLEEFPYFQNARTLIAKGSKQLKSKKAGLHINTAAIYATDRALLKRYINDQLIFLSPLDVHESHEAEREKELDESIKTSKVVNAKVKQAASEEKAPPKKKVIMRPQPEETKAVEPEALIEDPVPSDLDNIIDELYKDLEALKENRAKLNKIENDLAEQEAVDAAVQKATKKADSKPKEEVKEEAKAEPTPQVEEPKEEKSTEVEPEEVKAETKTEDATVEKVEKPKSKAKPTKEKDKSDEESTIDESPEEIKSKVSKISEEISEEIEAEEKEKPKRASQSRSARRTVKLKKDDDAETSKKAESSKKAAAKEKPAKESSKAKSKKKDSSTNKGTTKKATTAKKSSNKDDSKDDSKSDKGEAGEKSRKVDQDSIISNFIKTNPSISPADATTSKAPSGDLSTGSSELHPEIASEYLAEIYLEQGSYDRAIQIYEALIVRFPEKSVYFADIIKKVNEQR